MPDLITMDIAYIPEERESNWAFYVRDFGFRVYAKNQEEGEEVVSGAIHTLIDSLRNDRPRLTKYLDARGVKYQIQSGQSEASDSQVKSLRYERELNASPA